ncbi:phosphocarrier protein [Dethiosulfatibacter aminovorans DSM 17477]|uniref:Phosphocarrier protein HPr n=1 Tax=Dethiosulfatibacter aminovorans DSM 17477 TaxID=1121476 RepID=A0A1M6GD32_9FIRM|nr:HPr family phosphocarrier protein [Dethiosulfatibacter aminovorans]SHJ07868.1 phosphocarrier protein [Dethiosulfatibacter aminovorans DSM 17477]
MYAKEVLIQNETGFHIRPAQIFVDAANKFESDIKVVKEDKEVAGKSILGLMTMGAVKGMTITIKAEGNDEMEAVNELVNLIENKFFEE